MEKSIYKIIEVVGFSETSWEDAAKVAVTAVDKSVRDMR
ncbi:MAG: dodecin domain-containing protein, partial [Desulfobacula sp.]|nr:dodecin domain-containing protein [Desulfobacula sp.]